MSGNTSREVDLNERFGNVPRTICTVERRATHHQQDGSMPWERTFSVRGLLGLTMLVSAGIWCLSETTLTLLQWTVAVIVQAGLCVAGCLKRSPSQDQKSLGASGFVGLGSVVLNLLLYLFFACGVSQCNIQGDVYAFLNRPESMIMWGTGYFGFLFAAYCSVLVNFVGLCFSLEANIVLMCAQVIGVRLAIWSAQVAFQCPPIGA